MFQQTTGKRKKPLLRILVFLLIFCVLFAPFVLSGELYPAGMVVKLQPLLGDAFRYGPAYTNSVTYYKLHMAQQKQARVLALGTSRVMQLKGFFFRDGVSFYNAGGSMANSDAAQYVLERLGAQAKPDILLLGLDEYFFNDAWSNVTSDSTYAAYDTPDQKSLPRVMQSILSDAFSGKIQNVFSLAFSPAHIGVMAKVNDQGFEQDGSYYYGSVYRAPKPDAERIAPTMQDIADGAGRYVSGGEINLYTVQKLAELCEYAAANNIYIVAFAPPLAPSCYAQAESSGRYAYFNAIDETAGDILRHYGFEYYGYTDAAGTLSLDDSYFVDGFHGSDSAYLALLLDMLAQDSRLNEICDEAALQAMYDRRLDNLRVRD